MRVKILSERPMGKRVQEYLEGIGEEIVDENPDILIVCYYPRILKKEEFENIPLGAINFHPGLLPYNRGMYPHIWPLVDGSPAGVTIHYIDENVDTGDIIVQRELPVYPTDIASDLEDRTQEAMFELFCEVWEDIKKGCAVRTTQGFGSHHYAREIKTIQEFDRDTIYRLRAQTFRDRSYAYFYDEDGNKVYVGVKFFTEDDIRKFEEER